uniref:Uncharacterized protein n=1 Tax=Acrobeloides nanus TaxID=290746 RepID=A0A914C603_9BILA
MSNIILGLGDLNSENVGFDENTAAPYIVDFQTSFIDSSVIFEDINHPKTVMSPVYKLKMNLGQFLELVKDKTFDEQLGIAKESIVRWDIDSKLDEAMAKLEEQKIIFNRTDLLFEKGTETVKEYIHLIREKVNRIINP